MNKKLILTLITALITATGLMSCSEENNSIEEFANWQETNDEYFAKVHSTATNNLDGQWKVFNTWTVPAGQKVEKTNQIAVNVLKEGNGSGSPMYTDSVLVHYRGRLIPSPSYSEGLVFDESYTGELNTALSIPTRLAVDGVIDGFSTALQNMNIGDFWRVYIPYNLGYGSTDNSNIPAYSTLVFDIYLVAYGRPGHALPNCKTKEMVWFEE